MTDEPQISILDARLAEIDRRLRTIQTGLADDAGTQPGAVTALAPKIAVPEPGERADRATAPSERTTTVHPVSLAPAPPEDQAPTSDYVLDEDPALVIAELRGLIADHARLLDAMGELLASGERLLARAHVPVPSERRSPLPAAPPPPAQVTVTAGPFLSLEAVRDFERALAALPNVASVDVRGYEGEDRAMVDVHLSRPNP